LLFNATSAKPTPFKTRPLEEQDGRESQKLWQDVTAALKNKDQGVATSEKSRIEDMQRQEANLRTEEGVEWRPRLFRPVDGGHGGSEEGEEDLDWIVNAKLYVLA
jgi:oxysterol-binding protein-related protein 8